MDDLFQNLSLSQDFVRRLDFEELLFWIKTRYRGLAMVDHPDKGGDDKTFAKETEAHEVLTEISPSDRSELAWEYGKPTEEEKQRRTVQQLEDLVEDLNHNSISLITTLAQRNVYGDLPRRICLRDLFLQGAGDTSDGVRELLDTSSIMTIHPDLSVTINKKNSIIHYPDKRIIGCIFPGREESKIKNAEAFLVKINLAKYVDDQKIAIRPVKRVVKPAMFRERVLPYLDLNLYDDGILFSVNFDREELYFLLEGYTSNTVLEEVIWGAPENMIGVEIIVNYHLHNKFESGNFSEAELLKFRKRLVSKDGTVPTSEIIKPIISGYYLKDLPDINPFISSSNEKAGETSKSEEKAKYEICMVELEETLYGDHYWEEVRSAANELADFLTATDPRLYSYEVRTNGILATLKEDLDVL